MRCGMRLSFGPLVCFLPPKDVSIILKINSFLLLFRMFIAGVV